MCKPRKSSKREIFNDLNQDVVNFFEVARHNTDALVNMLRLTPYARHEYDRAHEPTDNRIEQARRFFVRSWMGLGGAGIRHKSGFRKSYRPDIRPEQHFANAVQGIYAIADRFSGVCIENRDYLDIIANYDTRDTVFYLDPPYVHESRTGTALYKHELTDHGPFIDCVTKLKGTAIISGYPNSLYDRSLSTWARLEISLNTTGQTKRTECIWMNRHNPTLFQNDQNP